MIFTLRRSLSLLNRYSKDVLFSKNQFVVNFVQCNSNTDLINGIILKHEGVRDTLNIINNNEYKKSVVKRFASELHEQLTLSRSDFKFNIPFQYELNNCTNNILDICVDTVIGKTTSDIWMSNNKNKNNDLKNSAIMSGILLPRFISIYCDAYQVKSSPKLLIIKSLSDLLNLSEPETRKCEELKFIDMLKTLHSFGYRVGLFIDNVSFMINNENWGELTEFIKSPTQTVLFATDNTCDLKKYLQEKRFIDLSKVKVSRLDT